MSHFDRIAKCFSFFFSKNLKPEIISTTMVETKPTWFNAKPVHENYSQRQLFRMFLLDFYHRQMTKKIRSNFSLLYVPTHKWRYSPALMSRL